MKKEYFKKRIQRAAWTIYNDHINRVQSNIITNPAEFWRYPKTKEKTTIYPRDMEYNGFKIDKPSDLA